MPPLFTVLSSEDSLVLFFLRRPPKVGIWTPGGSARSLVLVCRESALFAEVMAHPFGQAYRRLGSKLTREETVERRGSRDRSIEVIRFLGKWEAAVDTDKLANPRVE